MAEKSQMDKGAALSIAHAQMQAAKRKVNELRQNLVQARKLREQTRLKMDQLGVRAEVANRDKVLSAFETASQLCDRLEAEYTVAVMTYTKLKEQEEELKKIIINKDCGDDIALGLRND